MIVELLQSRINDEIIKFLENNYSGENTRCYEHTFILNSKFKVTISFDIENYRYTNIEFCSNCIIAEQISNPKKSIELKIISRNPNPNSKTLKELYSNFINDYEDEIIEDLKDFKAIKDTESHLNLNMR